MQQLLLNRKALMYSALQHFNNALFWNSRIIKRIANKLPWLQLNKSIVFIESYLWPKRLSKLFNANIESDYKMVKSYLPELPQNANILDIGCGVAGMDVFLWRHYKGDINIHLLDKTQISRKSYLGCRDEDRFYASLPVAEELLKSNGVLQNNIFTQEVTTNCTIDFNKKFDLIVSFASWGFNFPLEIYLEQVYEKLNKDARLLVCLRKNMGYEDLLKNKFKGANFFAFKTYYEGVLAICTK